MADKSAEGRTHGIWPAPRGMLLLMGQPKKTEEPLYGPHPDDAADFADPAGDVVLDVDAEAHLRWLETGEGDPWPPARSD